MFDWLRNKIRLGQTFQEFASYVTPDVAPSTPFQNGFDAFMTQIRMQQKGFNVV